MNGCLKCIHKPFCTLSACGAVCSSFKDKDRYADRNEVIREFAERLKELLEGEYIKATNPLENAQNIVVSTNIKIIDTLVKEMTAEAEL